MNKRKVRGAHYRRNVLATALVLSLGITSVAMAQSTVGSVYGTADPGTQLQLTNLGSGQSRSVTVGKDGRFDVGALQSGAYRVNVTENGQATTRKITVVAGQGFNLNLVTTPSAASAQSLSTVSVVANALPTIDVSSVQTNTALTAAQIKQLPLARNQTAVALLTPGAVKGDSGFGNLASFSGSSVAENSYYVNGFNVSSYYQSITYSQVPFEAIDQEQVQDGGYGAEYGNSTGGVISVQTKRGTNEWKGGVDVTWNPEFLQAKQPNIYQNNGTLTYNNSGNRNFSVGNAANAGPAAGGGGNATDFNLRENAWIGGPLIKDKLFMFALLGGTKTTDASYGSVQNAGSGAGYQYSHMSDPTYLVKLDWNINDDNILEFTSFSDTQHDNQKLYNYGFGADGQPYHYQYFGQINNTYGGSNNFLKYTGYLTDAFTVTAQYGRTVYDRGQTAIAANGTVESYDGNLADALNSPGCPGITDSRLPVTAGTVPAYNSCGFAGSLGIPTARDITKAGRVDFEYKVGQHDLTAGYAETKFSSFNGSALEGGAQYTYATIPTKYGSGGTDAPSDSYVQAFQFTTGSRIGLRQKSEYVQDMWHVTDNFLLRLGIRNDSFSNQNGLGETYVSQSHSWQPRLGFSWDVHGDSSLKIYGSAGDYSLPLDNEVALRGASASIYGYQYYTYTGVNPTTGAPEGLQALSPTSSNAAAAAFAKANPAYVGHTYYNGENGQVPYNGSSAATNLRPFKQREFILGAQQTLADWTFGVKGVYRKVLNGTDDICDVRPIYAYLNAHYGLNLPTSNDLGPTGSQALEPGGCYIANPGSSATLNWPVMAADGSTKIYNVDLSAADIGAPRYKRDYESIELTAEHSFTDSFYVRASYTWSRLWGNTDGLVTGANKQTDTGTSFLFDYPELMAASSGYQSNDRRNTFKLYGAYEITPEWLVGANFMFQTGAPESCFGLAPVDGGIGGGYGNTYFYCDGHYVSAGSVGRTHSIWQLDANVAYHPSWAKGLSLRATIFNVFNKHEPTSVNQEGEDGAGNSLAGTTYLMPTAFQTPRYVQLSAEYDFSL